MRILFCICLSLVFLACSKNDNIIANLKSQTLIHTQKAKFTYLNTNYIITLSFLSPVLDRYKDDDIFAIFIAPNDFDISNLQVFINSNFVEIQPIEKDDELLKYLIQNEYAKYYKFSAKNNASETITAKICSNIFTCFELSFQRYSKSLYYRSKDENTQYNLQEPF
ncbi:hypothetical protein CAV_1741 [Campylobacter avium LMG 24591]|uniref:Lipoprotein n=1 Tax=Campylobacter avium LMG 24591 TaxID=522484 RepID=A0A222MW74_9BACT|nr:hypothetical protein [Campylobacter avium]ASQ30159.1 hypothetical protein CAV_1741 [Campylobacter avium LMG 24591]OYD79257.1 hypothetical protein CAV8706_0494 [Campylobacter avium]